jgi:hypothetical protein
MEVSAGNQRKNIGANGKTLEEINLFVI